MERQGDNSPYSSPGMPGVITKLHLNYLPEYGNYCLNSGHALVVQGFETVNGVQYVDITNGWNIQRNTTRTIGTNPDYAYPITWIVSPGPGGSVRRCGCCGGVELERLAPDRVRHVGIEAGHAP